MNTSKFVLVLDNVDENTPNLEDNLFEAGCDDALINFRNGKVYLDFDREALSFDEAVERAIKDLQLWGFSISLVVCESISKYFNGDETKIALWFKMENPALGGISPLDMIRHGRVKKLMGFIQNQIEGDIP